MAGTRWQLQITQDLSAVPAADWDALVRPGNPFMRHAFLRTLEESKCVGSSTAWEPRHILLYASGHLTGAIPFYKKHDSYGEYVFDHGWADAYHRAGLPYYPKGVVAVPFTPANGNRILIHPEADSSSVVEALTAYLLDFSRQEGLSSVHFLFATDEERKVLENLGFLTRISTQFHWENHGYDKFDDYLAALRSGKRKQIRKERRQVLEESGLEIEVLSGSEIEPRHMDAMYAFYMDTGNRKWGRPYLNRSWFESILTNFPDGIVLMLAREGTRYVAGTLNFRDGARLFGRYWGAVEHFPCLHFELCYYRPIEFAIQNGMDLFEAGAQGEQKFLRGFTTRPCYSLHRMLDPGGQQAIAEFLRSERQYMDHTIDAYNAKSPLKSLRRATTELE